VIRTDGTSDDHDLAGYDQHQVEQLVRDAFTDPINAQGPIRLCFTIGGGKKCRQKYHPDLGRYLADSLRGLGYNEDRGASCVMECQGAYKRQHDTDKDLIFMQVFPRVEVHEEADAPRGKVDALSPEYMCTVCSIEAFQKMVEAKTPSLTQRRRLFKAMK